MTEFQAALLNVQLDRYDRECDTRDRNGRYLAGQLAEIPGIHPQPRGRDETRHAYHLFHFRYDAALFGAPAEVFVKALTEEGVPCGRGYGVPLYRQPLFANKAFGPYTGYRLARPDLDFGKVHCPCAEQVCASGCWLGHRMLLGPREHMDQIAAAVRKLYECRAELRELAGATPGAATR
jgi:dTDP-4-amino-4,6-dideoxygalactose transaminase